MVILLERLQTYCSMRQTRIIIGPTSSLMKLDLLRLLLVVFIGCAPYN